ncbi:pentapeptide repeat-containing protein, partial [Enterococcus faecium]|nr:pentapeptide repeat-containing protein [Enterococcus faecium]
SVLSSADFVDCSLTKIMFSTNDLENASFFDTDLKNIDLSSNSFEMIEVRSEHLKNCTLNQLQALGFARKFLQIKVV